jgi:hypothetical protein
LADPTRRRGGRIRALLLVLAVLTVASSASSCTDDEPDARVLLIGDSIMKQTAPHVEQALEERPGVDDVEVTTTAVNGSGLLTPGVFDWHTEAAELVAEHEPDIIAVLFIGNYTDDEYRLDATGEPITDYTDAFFLAWAEEANRLMEILSADGAQVYWVQPPPLPSPEGERRVTELRRVHAEVASLWPGTALIDGTAALADDEGHFAADLAAPPDGEVVQVRDRDGVHLTEAGGRILAATIARELAPTVKRLQERDR